MRIADDDKVVIMVELDTPLVHIIVLHLSLIMIALHISAASSLLSFRYFTSNMPAQDLKYD